MHPLPLRDRKVPKRRPRGEPPQGGRRRGSSGSLWRHGATAHPGLRLGGGCRIRRQRRNRFPLGAFRKERRQGDMEPREGRGFGQRFLGVPPFSGPDPPSPGIGSRPSCSPWRCQLRLKVVCGSKCGGGLPRLDVGPALGRCIRDRGTPASSRVRLGGRPGLPGRPAPDRGTCARSRLSTDRGPVESRRRVLKGPPVTVSDMFLDRRTRRGHSRFGRVDRRGASPFFSRPPSAAPRRLEAAGARAKSSCGTRKRFSDFA